MLVRTGNGVETERGFHGYSSVEVYDDLAAAARALIDTGVAR